MNEEPMEIIVVDSSSTDNTSELTRTYPIQYISIPERNRQRARNIGLSRSKGEIVAFIDDDVVADKNWSTNILIPYKDADVGGVGGRVIPFGKPASYYVKTKRWEIGQIRANGLILGNFDLPLPIFTEVDHMVGCNMSFRRDPLLGIGGFDENFIGNGFRDDTDASLRMRRVGYRLVYQPRALIWHKFAGRVVDQKWAYWYMRNSIYFYFKNISTPIGFRFPQFLARIVLIPPDYIKKSQVVIKPEVSIILASIRGIADGFLSIRRKRNLWKSS
jgi:GT2 family glycosyltransferase